MFLWYFALYFCGILLGVFVVNEISDIWNDYLTLWQVAAGYILASRMRMWSMWLRISAILSRNDKLGQNDDNCERDMGILLISLLAEEGVSTVLTLNLTCLTTSWGGRFFYLTRPLLLGEVPHPLLNPPLLRRWGLKAWPAGPVLASKLTPLKGVLVSAYATESRLYDATES